MVHKRNPFTATFCTAPKALALALCLLAGISLYAQDPKSDAKQDKDIIIFTNGEKLIGRLERSAGAKVVFKSDIAGEVTVDWSKVKEIHSSNKFAVVPKNVKLDRKEEASQFPRGTLSVANQQIQVTPEPGGTPQTVAVDNSAYVVSEPTFQNDILNNPNFFHGWAGAITAGATLVEATQKNQAFSGAVTLLRSIPSVTWLNPRNRTSLNFSTSYGKLTQPNTPTVKTDIYHLDTERDEYFSPRFYAFGAAAFDHNFSQGLDLQQTYGGGIGWTLIKDDNQQFDLKASVNYASQQFQDASGEQNSGEIPNPEQDQNQNLLGSTFTETYNRKLPRNILFNEQISISPAWNNLNAYSGAGAANLSLPVYKRFNITLGAMDTFLNNPPPGFRKNSFQFTSGITYTMP
ncbi:MAG TPA: DUF481 domain-containing protein [Bryobacteraceae bacterium]|nr:DUF481 domain-containing protein [Bryobacteraceae bacterium]